MSVLVLSLALAAGPDEPLRVRHLHEDLDAYIAAMEEPARVEWQKPDEVVRALKLKPGATVADVGAGPGYFSLRFARAVGAAGFVWALDVEPRMLAVLLDRTRKAKVKNVGALLVPPDDPSLPASSVDVAFICDTYHHLSNRPAYLKRLVASLKPGGRIVVVDFHKQEELPVGPPPSMKMTPEEVVAEAKAAGLALAAQEGFLPYQYFLVFAPAKPGEVR